MYGCIKLKRLLVPLICIALIITTFGLVRVAVPNGIKMASVTSSNGVFVPIIMYHSVSKDKAKLCKFIVSPNELEADMQYLQKNGYTAIFVKDLVSYVYDDVPLPEKPVILSFDDGYYNNMMYVLPLLKKYNMKAVISVIGSSTEKFSQTSDSGKWYSYFTWDDISELSQSGYIEIGNHTYNMHDNGYRRGCCKKWGESDDAYAKALDDDILKLQNMLSEKSGVTPITFTYPYGFVCDESIPLLKKMGFKATMTCYERPNYITKDPDVLFGLDRYNRPSGISTEKFMSKILDR